MSDIILLIGARLMGGSYLAAAHREGFRVAVVGEQHWLNRWQGDIDHAHLANEDSEEDMVRVAMEAARTHQPVGVVGYADEHVRPAALVAHVTGCASPGLLAAMATRNKSTLRSIADHAGLPQPRALTAPFDGLADLGGREATHVVQKILDGAGSEGVRLVSKADAPTVRDTPVLLEEYVAGAYYSSEAFVVDGQICFTSHTAKINSGPPEFVELGHLIGAACPTQVRVQVDDLLRGIVRAFGIGAGILHVEWIQAGERLALVEFAVRTPGDFIMYGIERAHGFDSFGAVVRAAVGLPPRPPRHQGARVALSFFPTINCDPRNAQALIRERWSEYEPWHGMWDNERQSHGFSYSDDRAHHVLLTCADEASGRLLAQEVNRQLASPLLNEDLSAAGLTRSAFSTGSGENPGGAA